jgi:flagellar biosynthesis protein FlhB
VSQESGEKTEQPTPRRLEEAIKRGQFARSSEVQTVFVLASVLFAFTLTGAETWRQFSIAMVAVLGHLHDIPLSLNSLQQYAVNGALVVAQCAAPVVIAALIGGLLAGGLQNRFQTASEALEPNWERLNPVTGLQRIFSFRSAAPTFLALIKLIAIGGLTYSVVKNVLSDPIFYSTVGVERIAGFMAGSSLKIVWRVVLVLVIIAAVDYAYQFWRTSKDLMMTREEVKDEAKSSEGNPQVKAEQRKKRRQYTQRKMLMEVPRADVVITNPTHLAVALRYDPKTMKAPKIVAKGARLNAHRIRAIAQQYQVPVIENKPLARLIFKYGKVGGEIPAQLYAAVAEILAWVYRVNRYRYYAEKNMA